MRIAIYENAKVLYDVYDIWLNNTKNFTLRQITHCTDFYINKHGQCMLTK